MKSSILGKYNLIKILQHSRFSVICKSENSFSIFFEITNDSSFHIHTSSTFTNEPLTATIRMYSKLPAISACTHKFVRLHSWLQTKMHCEHTLQHDHTYSMSKIFTFLSHRGNLPRPNTQNSFSLQDYKKIPDFFKVGTILRFSLLLKNSQPSLFIYLQHTKYWLNSDTMAAIHLLQLTQKDNRIDNKPLHFHDKVKSF